MRSRVVAHVAAAAVAIPGALALAQPALATDYCVSTACGGTDVNDFQSALNAAAADTTPDRIFLGPGTYTPPTQAGFEYAPMDPGPVEIIGAGPGTTNLTALSGSFRTLALFGPAGTAVRGLSVWMPPSVPAGGQALRTNGVVDDVYVHEITPQQSNQRTGVVLTGSGVLENSTISTSPMGNTTGIELTNGGTVRDSMVYGNLGINADNGGTIDRNIVTTAYGGIDIAGGSTKIASTMIHTSADGSIGVNTEGLMSSASIDIDGATIAADTPLDAIALAAGNYHAPTANVQVSLKNTVIHGYGAPLWLSRSGTGQVHVSASYSDYGSAANHVAGGATIDESNVSYAPDPGLGEDDFLLPDSPLIDAGDPETPQGLDLLSAPLVTDGDGDGIARRDIGAVESPGVPVAGGAGNPVGDGLPGAGDVQTGAPAASAPAPDTVPPALSNVRASHKVFAVGRAHTAIAARVVRGTRFSYTLSENAKVVATIQRVGGKKAVGKLTRTATSGRNALTFSGRIGQAALRPGRYRAVVVATDAAGNRSAPKALGFRIVKG